MKIAYLPYGATQWLEFDNVQMRDERGDVIFARKVDGEWHSLGRCVPFVRDLVRTKDRGILVNGVFGETTISPRRLQILEATPEERVSVFICLKRELSYRKRLRRGAPIDMGGAMIDTSKERT